MKPTSKAIRTTMIINRPDWWLLTGLLWVVTVYIAAAQKRPAAIAVVYADGTTAYRVSARASWQALDNKSKVVELLPSYELRLAPGSVLALARPNQSPVVVRQQTGVHTVATLLQTPPDDVAVVLSSYFQYLWHNLTHHHETLETYARGFMKTKGGISRDGCAPPLMLTPDYGASIPGDSAIRFVWKTDRAATSYTFAIYDDADEKANRLYETTTTDTALLVEIDKPFLERDVTYYWTVFSAGKPTCARYTFSLPRSETYRRVEEQIDALRRHLRTDAALMAFTEAALYEHSQFYPDAYRAYFRAYRLAPANQLYREGLSLFMARRGLVRQAQAILVSR